MGWIGLDWVLYLGCCVVIDSILQMLLEYAVFYHANQSPPGVDGTGGTRPFLLFQRVNWRRLAPRLRLGRRARPSSDSTTLAASAVASVVVVLVLPARSRSASSRSLCSFW